MNQQILQKNPNLSGEALENEKAENLLRPNFLKDFLGQNKIKENLQIFLNAAKKRGDHLDHTLFYGPPGLGKTTLSHIIAREMDATIKITSGPALVRSGDLASILTNLEKGDVLYTLYTGNAHNLSEAIDSVTHFPVTIID